MLEDQALGDRFLLKIHVKRKSISTPIPMEKITSGSSTILQTFSSRRARRSTNFAIKYLESSCARFGNHPSNLQDFPLNVAIWSQFTSDCLGASSWHTQDHEDFKRMAMNKSFPRKKDFTLAAQRQVKTLIERKDASSEIDQYEKVHVFSASPWCVGVSNPDPSNNWVTSLEDEWNDNSFGTYYQVLLLLKSRSILRNI